MRNKKINNSTFNDYDSKESTGIRFTLSKYDYDLFDETKNISLPSIEVKKISLPNKGKNWKVFSNGKLICCIECINLLDNEKNFLEKSDGLLFIIKTFKEGGQNENSFISKLKLFLSLAK